MCGFKDMKNYITISVVLLLLVNCAKHDDLDRWIQSENQKVAGKIKHTPVKMALTKPEPHDDNNDAGYLSPTSPFSSAKILGFKNSGAMGILERVNVGDIKYIGYLDSSSDVKALVELNHLVYTVFVNTKIGRRDGKITSITPKKIVVQEKAQDFVANLSYVVDVELYLNQVRK